MDQSLTLDSIQGPPHQEAEAEANVRRRRATFSILNRDGPRNPVMQRRDTDECEEEQAERQESDQWVTFHCCLCTTTTRLSGRRVLPLACGLFAPKTASIM